MLKTMKSIESRDLFILAGGYNSVGLCMVGGGGCSGAGEDSMQGIALPEEFLTCNPGTHGISMANTAVKCNLNGEFERALDFGKECLALVDAQLEQGSVKTAE